MNQRDEFPLKDALQKMSWVLCVLLPSWASQIVGKLRKLCRRHWRVIMLKVFCAQLRGDSATEYETLLSEAHKKNDDVRVENRTHSMAEKGFYNMNTIRESEEFVDSNAVEYGYNNEDNEDGFFVFINAD